MLGNMAMKVGRGWGVGRSGLDPTLNLNGIHDKEIWDDEDRLAFLADVYMSSAPLYILGGFFSRKGLSNHG